MSSEVLPFDHSGYSVFLPHHHCFIYLVFYVHLFRMSPWSTYFVYPESTIFA
jgi:hypothetical protein